MVSFPISFSPPLLPLFLFLSKMFQMCHWKHCQAEKENLTMEKKAALVISFPKLYQISIVKFHISSGTG